MTRLGIVTRPSHDSADRVAAGVAAEAAKRGMTTEMLAPDSFGEDIDVVIAVGGDGTMLHAAKIAHAARVPAFGVNVGHVGYLAEVEPPDVGAALDAIQSGKVGESQRATLSVRVGEHEHVVLNDAVFEKVISQHVVFIGVEVNGARLARYRADGVLVATPTGSTAYSFSAGGPVLQPDLPAMVLTPLAPHGLFNRSIVFGNDATLRFVVENKLPARLNVDGVEVATLEPGDSATVEVGGVALRLLDFGARRFPFAIRENFGLDDA